MSNNTNNNEQDQKEKKPSISAAQQVLDLKEEIKNLKIDLRDREARISGMEEIFNSLFKNIEIQSSVLYKQISKPLTQLTDLFGAERINEIQQSLNQLHNMNTLQQISLSNQFRQKLGLPPIEIEEEQPPK